MKQHARFFHHFSYHLIAKVGLKKRWCHHIQPDLYWLLSPAFDDALGRLALHPSEKHALLFRSSAGGCGHWQRGAYAHRRFLWRTWKHLAWEFMVLVRRDSFKSSLGIMKSWNTHLTVVVWKMFGISFNPDFWGKWWPMLRTVRSWVVANNHQLVGTFGGLGLKKEQLFQLPPFWRRVQQVRLHADRPPNVIFGPTTNPSEHLDPKFSQFSLKFTSESTSGMLTTVLHPWHTKSFNLFCN